MKLAPFDVTNENYHVGHLAMDSLRARPNDVCQLDAATGESETNASVLARSIQLATCFRKLRAKPGDVLALGGNNHLDLLIPYYAALMNGITIAGVDPLFKKNAATGESETNASVLARSIQLATCFRKLRAKPGDVLALGGNNHLDLLIPYYAALMNGITIAGVDPLFKKTEIQKVFKICSPRIAFCQKELLDAYQAVKEELGLNTEIICFDEGKHSLASFIDKYDDKENQEEFLPVIIDQNKHYAWLISTGGTTGVVKLAAFTHRSSMKKLEMLQIILSSNSQLLSGENKMALDIAPVQGLSSFVSPISFPLLCLTKLQTSNPLTTVQHIIDLINQYRPIATFLGPSTVTALIKNEKKCDFTCFERIMLSGGKIHRDVHLELRKRVRPGIPIVEMYGQTENLGRVFAGAPDGPIGNCGKIAPALPEVKIVDVETGREITEPNVPGEIWTKGAYFAEYYNNPEETKASFTEDGWYKTGDILYRDEDGYFFFVERLKMLIKYRLYHIMPPELEAVIREHPDVLDVSVTSVPHEDDGEHPVACVMKRPGSKVTAADIKEMVANKLSDSQRLRGGVIFMDQLPMTSTGKIARGELRKLALTLHRE